MQTPIPSNGWWDRNHMNIVGADVISTWLGQHLAEAVNNGEIHISSGK